MHIILQNHEESVKRKKKKVEIIIFYIYVHQFDGEKQIILNSIFSTSWEYAKDKSGLSKVGISLKQTFAQTLLIGIIRITTSESEIILKFLKLNISSAAF